VGGGEQPRESLAPGGGEAPRASGVPPSDQPRASAIPPADQPRASAVPPGDQPRPSGVARGSQQQDLPRLSQTGQRLSQSGITRPSQIGGQRASQSGAQRASMSDGSRLSKARSSLDGRVSKSQPRASEGEQLRMSRMSQGSNNNNNNGPADAPPVPVRPSAMKQPMPEQPVIEGIVGASLGNPLNERTYQEVEYLKRSLGPILVAALAEICIRRPADPIEYLGHWLLRWRYNEELKRRDVQNALEVVRKKTWADETGLVDPNAPEVPPDPESYGSGFVPQHPYGPPGYGGPLSTDQVLEALAEDLPLEEEDDGMYTSIMTFHLFHNFPKIEQN